MPGPERSLNDFAPPGAALRVYLLGTLPFDSFLAFQRRLVYEISGDPQLASLVICDHPPEITIGREGSRLHIRPTPEQLAAQEWRVRWVARGGGVMLHLPGQVCAYPILPLAGLQMTPAQYRDVLLESAADALRQHKLEPTVDAERPGLRIGDRRVAHAGLAIRSGVTGFGLVVNVCPDLELFEAVACDGEPRPMTSLERESPLRIRPAAVRLDLADAIARRFGFTRQSVFHTHTIFHANAASR
ncbi:lipoyl(octanoyl) transferase LipB [Limnoglobus roseus]|uniref:Octanoyltransferase n=1 Tax=Limnoglobus roseus TaxID=2598579 RepID=A0A5C1AJV4_9BACT|nr:hypothetical protein [Limnoglobus roseus]QEL19679.1 lipoate--protein ligase B [Limnoglobus roseus]